MLQITATELPRVIACNGSLNMETIAPFETEDTGRKEGNAVHWLVEQVHKFNQPLEGMLNKQAPNGLFITNDMIADVTEYLNDIKGVGAVEFDTSAGDKNGKWYIGGRADHLLHTGGTLIIRDFKYGWRIVEPKMNYTLIWHAIGFLKRAEQAGIPYTGATLSMFEFIVYQPRPYHPKGFKRRWLVQRGDLMTIWEKVEQILANPDNKLNTGPHCYKCPSMVNATGICPAISKAMNNAIEASEETFTDTLKNEDLGHLLDTNTRAKEVLEQVIDAMQDLAKHRITKGQVIPNYSVQPALTNRRWNANVTADFLKAVTGKDLQKVEMRTPAQVEKLGVSPKLVDSLTTRDTKGLNLVRASADDQARKMFNPKESA